MTFGDHAARIAGFVDRAPQIIEQIEARLLNVQGKELARRDRARLEQSLDACFGEARALGRLATAHAGDGFEPVALERRAHQLDPVELIARAYDYWEHQRWPGRTGRLTFASAVYSACLVRQFEHLVLRIWDDGDNRASDRLGEVQRLLDRLNALLPRVFVRDARWLIQTAQGPLTRDLGPYFRTAAQISSSLTDDVGVEIHKAGAKLAGGHLRSQLLYRTWESGLGAGDPAVLTVTRNSNSMDVALLVQDLVPLLEAYDVAHDVRKRLDLADAILQGVSADPELLLCSDHLGAYTTIEDVFVERSDDGRFRYTPLGERHRSLVARYGDLVGRVADRLSEDAVSVDPATAAYSPFGIAYGFCADLLSNMAATALTSPRVPLLALEDMFDSRDHHEAKQALAGEWRQLPRKEDELEHFVHSAEWANHVFTRATEALRLRTQPPQTARLFVVPESRSADVPPGVVPAQEHCITSDLERALATGATAFPKSQILLDRREARYLASAESGGRWFCVSKAVLTACITRGRAALIKDVPVTVIDELRLTCGDILEVL